MYYLETKNTVIVKGKQITVWKPVCYSARREPLDETVRGLSGDAYRVIPASERRSA